jgi:cytidylate kinase
MRAADAIYIDTTGTSASEVVDRVMDEIASLEKTVQATNIQIR